MSRPQRGPNDRPRQRPASPTDPALPQVVNPIIDNQESTDQETEAAPSEATPDSEDES